MFIATVTLMCVVCFGRFAEVQEASRKLYDFGPDAKRVADGYTAVTPEATAEKNSTGWTLGGDPARFYFYRGPDSTVRTKLRDHPQVRVQGTAPAFHEKRRWIGAFEKGKQATVRLRFELPVPIRRLWYWDEHRRGKKDPGRPDLRMSLSRDGTNWKRGYRARRTYRGSDFIRELTDTFAGARRIHVRYRAASHGRVQMLALRGTLKEPLPEDFDPSSSLLRFRTSPKPEGAFRDAQPPELVNESNKTRPDWIRNEPNLLVRDPALYRDGVLLRSQGKWRLNLAPGTYYVEAVGRFADVPGGRYERRRASFEMEAGDTVFTDHHAMPWRKRGVRGGPEKILTQAGRIEHEGGPLTVTVRPLKTPLKLCGLRIYGDAERKAPARFVDGRVQLKTETDDKAVEKGMKLFRKHNFVHHPHPEVARKVVEAFRKVEDPHLRATLVTLGGIRPGVSEMDPVYRTVRSELEAILREHPHNLTARDLRDDLQALIVEEAEIIGGTSGVMETVYAESRGSHGDRPGGYGRRSYWEQIPEESLVHPLMQLAKARFLETNQRDRWWKKDRYKPFLKEARRHYPNDPIVRMYGGEKIPWGERYREGAEEAPRWAALQREMIGRQLSVIDWWIDNRQGYNGRFKGVVLSDQVELMRRFTPYVQGLGHEKAIRSQMKLADTAWNNTTRGFFSHVQDVEHSAEMVADTQPNLIHARFGDPKWVERNMLTMTRMRDVWAAENPQGDYLFRSAWVGAEGIGQKQHRAVDVPYATRAIKSGFWVSWYNHHPEVVRMMVDRAEAWRKAAMSTDRGKPKGIPPQGIAWKTGQLGGYGPNWWNPDLGWDYYKFGGPDRSGWFGGPKFFIYEQLMLAYRLTGKEKFVEPHRATLELIRTWIDRDLSKSEPGSAKWAVRQIIGKEDGTIPGYLVKYCTFANDHSFDALLEQYGGPYARYWATGKRTALAKKLEEVVKPMRYNFPKMTSEAGSTDNVSIGGLDTLWAMVTGSTGNSTYAQAFSVTWSDAGRDTAMLVEEGTKDRFRVHLYNFRKEARTITMHPWRIAPCEAQLTVATAKGETKERTVRVPERGAPVEVTLPPRREVTLTMQVKKKRRLDLKAEDRSDVAIAQRDVTFGKPRKRDRDLKVTQTGRKRVKPGTETRIHAVVHNIGARKARGVRARFYAVEGGEKELLGTKRIGRLPPPEDLSPSTKTVSMTWDVPASLPDALRVEVETASETVTRQITRRNDSAVLPPGGKVK